MLARLQRSLALSPSRFVRQLSTTPLRAFDERTDSQDDIDRELDWEQKSNESSATEATESSSSLPSEFSRLFSNSEMMPALSAENGLSYAGLPDHKIFLDIPPAQDPLIRYLASSLLHDGRRHTAERRAARVLLYLHTLTRAEPLPLLRKAVEKVMPAVRIARHKQSAKNIDIPVALNEKQQVRYAMKWMLHESQFRGGRTVEERLAREIVLVNLGTSKALEAKVTQHKTAMINRGNIPVGRASL